MTEHLLSGIRCQRILRKRCNLVFTLIWSALKLSTSLHAVPGSQKLSGYMTFPRSIPAPFPAPERPLN